LGNLFPLVFFDGNFLKIFHPVDEPLDQQAIHAANGAHILFSVTREILDKYKLFEIPSYFINHGVSDEFLEHTAADVKKADSINVGLSGNWLRPDIDRKILLEIVRQNPDSRFHFYGSYQPKQSNIGVYEDKDTDIFIQVLQSMPNVVFYGVLDTKMLAAELAGMDLLLICYDIELDQSGGTNYHKVMEYLATGHVIVSNNITTYQEYSQLIRMAPDRKSNDALPDIFKDTIIHLSEWNSIELRQKRVAFANDNSYQRQLERIDGYIGAMLSERSDQQAMTLS
jgi:hypothetical protein